jgi:hypothetical protein
MQLSPITRTGRATAVRCFGSVNSRYLSFLATSPITNVPYYGSAYCLLTSAY